MGIIKNEIPILEYDDPKAVNMPDHEEQSRLRTADVAEEMAEVEAGLRRQRLESTGDNAEEFVKIDVVNEKKERAMAEKILVTWFSAEGTTAKIASSFAQAIGADTFEIIPEKPYTAADIKWTNPLSRCNREKFGKKDVPVNGRAEGFEQYDTVFIGFPIWYGCAPNVVNTFCRGYDWAGKKTAVFATSGGSGIGKTAEKLRPFVKGGEIIGAKLVSKAAELEDWLKSNTADPKTGK